MTTQAKTRLSTVVFLWVMLSLVRATWAAVGLTKETCWSLQSFLDTIVVTYQPLTNLSDPITLAVQSDSDGAYYLEGGTVAAITPDKTRAVLAVTMHNTDPVFFDGNPVGRFNLSVDLVTGEGPWYADFGAPIEPPFGGTGTLMMI